MPSVSKKQQRFMGMVHACKKSGGEDCASPEVEKAAKSIKAKDAKDFASTKHKGLPEKKKEKNEMKIKGSELKQIVKEELEKMISEGDHPDWGPYDADADAWYEYRHMADQDMWNLPSYGHLVSPAGDTPEDIAKQMIESGVAVTDDTAADAAMNSGVLDDDLADFVDAIIMAAEELQIR